MAVVVRYPGRICLLGEHCDWAGGASLVVPLPLSLAVHVEPAAEGLSVSAALGGELLEGRWPIEGGVFPGGGALRFAPAAAAVLADHGIHPPPCHLRIEGDLPAGRGFSSSAATCLGLLDGLARHAGVHLQPLQLAELAFEVEHVRLGVACGRLDPIACAIAQPVWIRWYPLPDGSFEPSVRRLDAATGFHLVAASFPRPRDTVAILRTLQQAARGDLRDALQAEHVRRVRTAVQCFADQAARGAMAMEHGRADWLGAALDAAQQAYEDELADGFVALRAPLLWQTCKALRHHGALGAKFTGAGGDGSVIGLMPDESSARAAVDLLQTRGLQAWYCSLSEDSTP